MAEMIDREALKEALLERGFYPAIVEGVLESAPTVDAVPVVRCRECKHLMFSDFYGECKRGNLGIVKPDDFCSYGERKEDA